MTSLQKVLLGSTLLAVVGAGVFEAHRNSALSGHIQLLQQQQATLTDQIATFKSNNEALANQLRAGRSAALSSDRLRELLRLRAEVGALRRRQQEMEQKLGVAQSKTPTRDDQSRAEMPRLSVPAPFQVQLVLDRPGEASESVTNLAGETLEVQKTPLMDHTAIRAAIVTKDSTSGSPAIDIEFSPEGQELFAAVTRDNLNKRLAIVLDGQVFSAPLIRSEILEGKALITGNFTGQEAAELAAKINAATRSQ